MRIETEDSWWRLDASEIDVKIKALAKADTTSAGAIATC